VELEDREEQPPELLLMDAKRNFEFQFQQLEEVVEADYWFDQINLEEVQEKRTALERYQRGLVVRFGKLLIDGKSRESGA